MMRYSMMFAGLALLALAGCAGNDKKDYDAQATCGDKGYTSGTKEYDHCVQEEKTGKLMEQQQQEYEQMKQEQDDWKTRRF